MRHCSPSSSAAVKMRCSLSWPRSTPPEVVGDAISLKEDAGDNCGVRLGWEESRDDKVD